MAGIGLEEQSGPQTDPLYSPSSPQRVELEKHPSRLLVREHQRPGEHFQAETSSSSSSS